PWVVNGGAADGIGCEESERQNENRNDRATVVRRHDNFSLVWLRGVDPKGLTQNGVAQLIIHASQGPALMSTFWHQDSGIKFFETASTHAPNTKQIPVPDDACRNWRDTASPPNRRSHQRVIGCLWTSDEKTTRQARKR